MIRDLIEWMRLNGFWTFLITVFVLCALYFLIAIYDLIPVVTEHMRDHFSWSDGGTSL